jgi:hypothetical protein
MKACIVTANEQLPSAAPRSLAAAGCDEVLPWADFANYLPAYHQHLLSYWLVVLCDEQYALCGRGCESRVVTQVPLSFPPSPSVPPAKQRKRQCVRRTFFSLKCVRRASSHSKVLKSCDHCYDFSSSYLFRGLSLGVLLLWMFAFCHVVYCLDSLSTYEIDVGFAFAKVREAEGMSTTYELYRGVSPY